MEEVINKARGMRAKFLEKKSHGRNPLAINTKKLIDLVSEETGWNIEVQTLQMDKHLRGMMLRTPSEKKALVLISDENNQCWKRFVLVKEISHLFLDDESSYVASAMELAEALTDRDFGDDDLYWLDASGVYAAVELMIPESLKTHILHLSNVKKESSYVIASKLKVPRRYVEIRLKRWGAEGY